MGRNRKSVFKRPKLEKEEGWTVDQLKTLKLKKQAILVSYCGSGYYGLQISRDVPTIEGEVLNAFLRTGMIHQDHIKVPQAINFQRAARTDKGVSAVRQILSCLLPLDFKNVIPKVNEVLPAQIRVVASKFTTKNFDCKNACDARTYAYMMPTFALCPPEKLTEEAYRVTPEILDEFNRILYLFKGSHNYHNFTSRKAPTDPSSVRNIISVECGQPFVKDGIEFVIVHIKGQSFMMHQIRKMIGLSLGIMRGFANMDAIEKSFRFQKMDIPKAPGLGLVLEEVHYNRYNQRFGNDGIHEPLCWDEYNDSLDKFKHEHIYPVIVETEKNENSMLNWLQTLPNHTYGERVAGSNTDRVSLTECLGRDDVIKPYAVAFHKANPAPKRDATAASIDSDAESNEPLGEPLESEDDDLVCKVNDAGDRLHSVEVAIKETVSQIAEAASHETAAKLQTEKVEADSDKATTTNCTAERSILMKLEDS